MDPRHPELAISRMRELMKQYDRVESDMKEVTTSAKLAELEREGGLVIQEICLVAPRIHEAMMQASRQRRVELARQILIPSTDEETKKSLEFFKEAEKEGLVSLKGHRSVGGMRASIYNAMPVEGVKKLVDFMKQFEADNA